jgi:hypothetical protein
MVDGLWFVSPAAWFSYKALLLQGSLIFFSIDPTGNLHLNVFTFSKWRTMSLGACIVLFVWSFTLCDQGRSWLPPAVQCQCELPASKRAGFLAEAPSSLPSSQQRELEDRPYLRNHSLRKPSAVAYFPVASRFYSSRCTVCSPCTTTP